MSHGRLRTWLLCCSLFIPAVTSADDLWYTYDGDVLPYDPSAGWLVSHACAFLCSDDVQDGHFVLRWAYPTDLVSYSLIIDGLVLKQVNLGGFFVVAPRGS